jgi:hypothetical protein
MRAWFPSPVPQREKIPMKTRSEAKHQWLMPVILATWEAEIRRIVV